MRVRVAKTHAHTHPHTHTPIRTRTRTHTHTHPHTHPHTPTHTPTHTPAHTPATLTFYLVAFVARDFLSAAASGGRTWDVSPAAEALSDLLAITEQQRPTVGSALVCCDVKVGDVKLDAAQHALLVHGEGWPARLVGLGGLAMLFFSRGGRSGGS